MKNTGKKIIAAVSAILMCISAVSCSGKKSSDMEKSEITGSETNTISSNAGTSAEAASETKAAASSAEEKTEQTSEKESDKTEQTTVAAVTAAADTTAATVTTVATSAAVTEALTENQPKDDAGAGGYTSNLEIAQEFYNAYLSRDPEKIYGMFDQEEMINYGKMIESELDGKTADEVFSKQAVMKAIGASMDSIDEIMTAYSDSESDKWSVAITSDDMETADEKSLESFNSDLKTSYSSAVIINYIFYKNETNGESFTGNSSAFIEKNGKWYLSYSSLMQSELLNYLEV